MERYQYDCCLCYNTDIQQAVMCKECQKPTCLVCRQKTIQSSLVCPHCKTNREFVKVKYGEELKNTIKLQQKCQVKTHESNIINAYCETCSIFICEKCKTEGHNSHNITYSFAEKLTEIHIKIENYKEMLRSFQSNLELEKKSKEDYIKAKQIAVTQELDKLMLAQKDHLKTELNRIKDSELSEITAKQMYLGTIKSNVNDLIKKNLHAKTDLERAHIYVKAKKAKEDFFDSQKKEVKIQGKSLESINNNNLFPPYHVLNLELKYSKTGNKSIGTTSKVLYNCCWTFKLKKNEKTDNIDLIYKTKGFRKETLFFFVIEVISFDCKCSDRVTQKTEVVTNDTCFGFPDLIKNNMYNSYSKNDIISFNFYIKYSNYHDIIQDYLQIQ